MWYMHGNAKGRSKGFIMDRFYAAAHTVGGDVESVLCHNDETTTARIPWYLDYSRPPTTQPPVYRLQRQQQRDDKRMVLLPS